MRVRRIRAAHERLLGVVIVSFTLAVIFLAPFMFATALLGPVFFIGIMVLLLLPLSKKKLGGDDTVPKTSRSRWILQILLIQVVVGFLLFTVTVNSLSVLQQSYNFSNPAELLANTFIVNSIFLGVQPWTMITLVAVTVGIIGKFHLGQKTSETYRPLLGYKMNGTFAAGVDSGSVFSTFLCIYTISMFALMHLSSILHTHYGTVEIAVHSKYAAALTTLLCVVCMMHTWQDTIYRSAKKRKQRITGTFVLIFLAWFAMFLFSDVFVQFALGSEYATLNKSVSVDMISTLPPLARWLFLLWLLSALFAPFVGAFINRISEGRTGREVIATVMALPTCIAFGLSKLNPTLVQAEHIEMVNVTLQRLNHLCQIALLPDVLATMSIIALAVVWLFFWLSPTANDCLIQMTANFAGKKSYRLRTIVIQSSPVMLWVLLFTIVLGFTGYMTMLGIFGMLSVVFGMIFPFCALVCSAFGLKEKPGQEKAKARFVSVDFSPGNKA